MTEKKKSLLRKTLKWALVVIGAVFALLVALVVWFFVPYFSEIDAANLPAHHPFKSAAAKKRYLDYYDLRSKQWPVPAETRTVETSYGKTFVRISGLDEAEPLVLLPGGGNSSLMWIPTVPALAAHYRVFAIDNLGDFGRSVATRSIKKPDDVVASLDELFTALGLRSDIHLMGLSYGGWQTTLYAAKHPERLRKVVIVAPAATLFNLPPGFAWRGLLLLLPYRGFLENMMRWSVPDLAQRTDEAGKRQFETLIDDGYIAMRSFDMKMMAPPTVLTDEQLGSITTQALFLVGEHEMLYPAQGAVSRLATAAPQIQTAIIPDAGHDLLWTQKDLVLARTIEFLKSVPAAK